MNAVILAAGNGQRFIDAGYTCPKPLLPMPDGRPAIAWITERLKRVADEIVVIARASDMDRMQAWCTTIIPQHTGAIGQVDSLRRALPTMHGEWLLTYCDVVYDDVELFVSFARQSGAPMAVVTFPSNDPRFGYWSAGQVHEKQVVSNRAVYGMVWTQDARDLHLDIAHANESMMTLLCPLTSHYHVSAMPLDIGTPHSYESFLKGQLCAF